MSDSDTKKVREEKEKELARMLKVEHSTVKGAKIPPVMLDDLYNRASRGEKISKFVTKPGAAVAIGSVALSTIALSGDHGGGGFAELAYIIGVLGIGTTSTLAGTAAFGTGKAFDKRKSIRRTVNTMALGRLAEIEADEEKKQLPPPTPKKFELK